MILIFVFNFAELFQAYFTLVQEKYKSYFIMLAVKFQNMDSSEFALGLELIITYKVI
jgi:hypothetical protein